MINPNATAPPDPDRHDLEAQVAKEVMHWASSSGWFPTYKMSHAAEVLEQMQNLGYNYSIRGRTSYGEFKAAFFRDDTFFRDLFPGQGPNHWVSRSSLGHAICLAALEAIRSDEKAEGSNDK